MSQLFKQTLTRGDTLNSPVLVFLNTDLTGVTPSLMVRSKNDTLIYVASPTITILPTDPVSSRVDFEVPATITELWSIQKKYYYDLRLEFPGGVVKHFRRTEITVVKEETYV